jgi:hypothetical protein
MSLKGMGLKERYNGSVFEMSQQTLIISRIFLFEKEKTDIIYIENILSRLNSPKNIFTTTSDGRSTLYVPD